MDRSLDPIAAVGHEVKDPIGRILDHRDGTAGRCESLWIMRCLEPVHHLTLHTERYRIVVEQGWCPGAGAQRHSPAVVFAPGCNDAHAAAAAAPSKHGFFDEQLGARLLGKLQMGSYAALGV